MKTTKTLGPASGELLLRLSAEGKTSFSIADARAITGMSYEATTALLSQLVRKRWLVRLVPWKEAQRTGDKLASGECEWSTMAQQMREKGLVRRGE